MQRNAAHSCAHYCALLRFSIWFLHVQLFEGKTRKTRKTLTQTRPEHTIQAALCFTRKTGRNEATFKKYKLVAGT